MTISQSFEINTNNNGTNNNSTNNTNNANITNNTNVLIDENNNNNNNRNKNDVIKETSQEAKMLKENSKFKERFDLENEINGYLDDNEISDLIFQLCNKFPIVFESIRQKMHYHSTLCKVFIRSLPYHTTENQLQQLFESYGNIKETCIVPDKHTGKSRVSRQKKVI